MSACILAERETHDDSDMVFELMDFSEPSPLPLETGRYFVWMTPGYHL